MSIEPSGQAEHLSAQVSLARHATLTEMEGLVEAAQEHEATVSLGQAALALIRQNGHYKPGSFEQYAFDRFGISRSSAYRWVKVGDWLLAELAAARPINKAPSQRQLTGQVAGQKTGPNGQKSRSARTAPRDIPAVSEPVIIPTTATELPESKSAQAARMLSKLVVLKPADVGAAYEDRRDWVASAKRLLRWATDFDTAAKGGAKLPSSALPLARQEVQTRFKGGAK